MVVNITFITDLPAQLARSNITFLTVVQEVSRHVTNLGLIENQDTWKPTPVGWAVLGALLVVSYKKLLLWTTGIIFLLLSSEKKGMSKYPDSKDVKNIEGSKIVIFIRHGESDWNWIFNKNKLLLLPRLIYGLLREGLMFMFDGSLFIDSPLSAEGVKQAKELKSHIFHEGDFGNCEVKHELRRALKNDEGALSSVLVASNLRRAYATGCIALWQRLSQKKEKMIIWNALQEMTRNVDTNSMASKTEIPDTSVVKKICPGFEPKTYLDVMRMPASNKKRSRKAIDDMVKFCGWCFEQEQEVIIVSGGHSIWFKNFFKTFLPNRDKNHFAGKQKIKNCAVVAFTLQKGVGKDGNAGFRIEPESLTNIYLGWDKVKDEEVPNKLKLPSQADSKSVKDSSKAKKSWYQFW